MLLSVQQEYILEVVRKLGYIQRQQLYILLRRQFQQQGWETSDAGMNAMLHQLRVCCEDVRLDDHGIGIAGVQSDPRRLEAVDIMLELSEDVPVAFHLGSSPPLLLRFVLGGQKIRLFTVADLDPGSSPNALERQRMERIVWISDSGVMPPGLTLPPKHFFAARQADGSHRFYGSEEP